MNTIFHVKRIWFLVVVLSGAGVLTCLSRVGHADFLPVYGGPTFSPATGGYLADGPAFAASAYVNNAGTAAAPVARANSEGLDIRAVRWSATSPPTELRGDPHSTNATGINSSGTVIGAAFAFEPTSPAYPYLYRPARWDASGTAATILDIPRDGNANARDNAWTLPLDINSSGTAVGQVQQVQFDEYGRVVELGFRAARWDAGATALTELGHLGTSNGIDGLADGYTWARANAINAAGAAAGFATKFNVDGSGIFVKAVRWDASAVAATELQAPATAPDNGRYNTFAKAINVAGIVVGDGEYSRYPAIRWDAAGNAAELGSITGAISSHIADSPKALNNAGTAVGYVQVFGNGRDLGFRAVRWDGTSTAATELGHLGTYVDGYTTAAALAVNVAGTVVGRAAEFSAPSFGGYHAVYWAANDTRAIDLNTLIDPTSEWLLEQALDISDTGWIVGVGQFDPDGPGGQDAYSRHFLIHVPATAIFPGDFNGDGAVDAADYVVWRKNFSSDQAMYDAWRANFGRTLSAGSGSVFPSAEPLSAAVPEPSAIALAALVLVRFLFRRKRINETGSPLV
jgi:hypothetical protein